MKNISNAMCNNYLQKVNQFFVRKAQGTGKIITKGNI